MIEQLFFPVAPRYFKRKILQYFEFEDLEDDKFPLDGQAVPLFELYKRRILLILLLKKNNVILWHQKLYHNLIRYKY